MSKEITKAFIIQEIEDKLKLRELAPERFSFSEMVVPIYDIGPHLTKWMSKTATVSITSGPSGYSFFIVPQEERWTLRAYNVIFMAAGAYKVTGVYLGYRPSFADTMYLDMKEAQTISYIVNLPNPVVIEPNSKIYVYVDDYTSTADLRLDIDVQVETIR